MTDSGLSDEQQRDDERRRFFRIHDRISLVVRRLDEAISPSTRGAVLMATAFDDMTRELTRHTEPARSESPALSAYMDSVNSKLDRMANWFALRELGLTAEPSHDVDLSASGISYEGDDRLSVDSEVELRMLLFPEHVCLVVRALVTRCEPQANGRFATALDFELISDAERDRIAGHVTRCQAMALRERARASLD